MRRLDCPTGIKVTGQELAAVNLKPAMLHGEWNDCILPVHPKK